MCWCKQISTVENLGGIGPSEVAGSRGSSSCLALTYVRGIISLEMVKLNLERTKIYRACTPGLIV